MKYVAIILAMVLVAGIIVVAVTMLSSDVVVLPVPNGITLREAPKDEAAFRRFVRASGARIGMEDISDYNFYTWRMTVSNNTHVPIEMVEATIVYKADDVPGGQTTAIERIEPGDDGELRVTVLTRKNTGASRDIIVSWYMWGRKDSKTVHFE